MATSQLSSQAMVSYELEEIIVEEAAPTTAFEFGDVIPDLESAFSHIISKTQFDNKVTDLAQVLATVPSVQIRRHGGFGSYAATSLRGSSGGRLPIFLDGVLLNDSSTGSASLQEISVGNIQQIEIYKGVVPIAFSQASIAGAINIRTLRPDKAQSLFSLGVGSFESVKLNAQYSQKSANSDILINASHFESKNNYPYVHNGSTQFVNHDDYATSRNNNAFAHNAFLLKAKQRQATLGEVLLTIDGNQRQKQLPTWRNDEDSSVSLDGYGLNSQIKWWLPYRSIINHRVTLGWKYDHQTYRDIQDDIGLGEQHVEYRNQRQFFNNLIQWNWSNHVFSNNIEVAQETFNPRDLLLGNEFSSSFRYTALLGLQSQSFLFADRVIVSPAVRWQYHYSHSDMNKYHDAIDARGSVINLQLGLQWQATINTKIKSNIARYTRLPTFNELFGDRGSFRGNAELDSETGINTDIGLDWRKLFAFSLLRELTVGVSAYQSDIDNVIIWRFTTQGIGSPDNIGRTRIRGLEFDIGASNKWLSLENSVNIESANNLDTNPAFHRKQLPGHAMISTSSLVSLFFPRQIALHMEYLTQIGKYYDEANNNPIDDQYRINTAIDWKPSDLHFKFEINNLLDQRTEDFYLNPIPGRAYFFTLQYQS